jgi:hypothetical protein
MAAAASAGYTKIFPLDGPHARPRPGYWLIVKKGHGIVVPSRMLPKEGQGWRYYWLGTAAHTEHANARLDSALPKFGINVVPGAEYDVSKAANGPWVLPGEPKGLLKQLLQGVDLVPIPGIAGGALGAGEAAAETGAAETGAAGAGAGAATGAETGAAAGAGGSLLAADAGAAAIISFIADPHLWIRLVEIVGGAALLLMGLKAMTGGTVDPVGTARKVARV